MTTRSRLNSVLTLATNLGAHRRTGATEETTTSHPDRNADSQHQSNYLVREQLHLLGVYSRENVLVEVANTDFAAESSSKPSTSVTTRLLA